MTNFFSSWQLHLFLLALLAFFVFYEITSEAPELFLVILHSFLGGSLSTLLATR